VDADEVTEKEFEDKNDITTPEEQDPYSDDPNTITDFSNYDPMLKRPIVQILQSFTPYDDLNQDLVFTYINSIYALNWLKDDFLIDIIYMKIIR